MSNGLWSQPPAQSHSATSIAAAESMKHQASRLRDVVLRSIIEKDGTDEELAERLGLSGNTLRPRRVELVKAGLVIGLGRRKTASGRSAIVWSYQGGVYVD
jgi:predicted ArsR family transcriptional regulator